jgi:phosphoglycerate dehydrogenase-like enzyme
VGSLGPLASLAMMLTISLPDQAAVDQVGPLPDDVQVVRWDGTGQPPPEFAEVAMYVAAYTENPPSAELLAGSPGLRVVQLLSAGVDPWRGRVPAGVILCNGRGVHGGSTAELAVGGLLASLRGFPRFAADQREHRWQPIRTSDLDDAGVLIVGAGDIARRVAAAVEVFGARPVLVGRTARDGVRGRSELPALLAGQAAIVLAAPLTEQTRGMVDAQLLAGLDDGAIVVNVARGALVDTSALLAELSTGRLRAFLDVTDPEPLPADHPLWDAPNLILTPHVGGGTRGWQRRAYALVREQILRMHRGEPLLNVVAAP